MQKSTIVVVPPESAALVPHSKSSADTVPMKRSSMWVCGSIPPGMTRAPPASTISAPAGASRFSPTATTRSPVTSTSARRPKSAFTTVPPRMSRAMVILRWCCSWRGAKASREREVGGRAQESGGVYPPLPVRYSLLPSRYSPSPLACPSSHLRVDDRVAPGALRLLGDHGRVAAGCEQSAHGPFVVRRVELAFSGCVEELRDLARHALLVLLGLGARRIVVEHDLGGLIRVLAHEVPALLRCGHELRHLGDERRVLQLVLHHIEAVF